MECAVTWQPKERFGNASENGYRLFGPTLHGSLNRFPTLPRITFVLCRGGQSELRSAGFELNGISETGMKISALL
jgi:hypothetical protein